MITQSFQYLMHTLEITHTYQLKPPYNDTNIYSIPYTNQVHGSASFIIMSMRIPLLTQVNTSLILDM